VVILFVELLEASHSIHGSIIYAPKRSAQEQYSSPDKNDELVKSIGRLLFSKF